MATQRHFEFRDGKSEKFWSIKLESDSHTVNYGRIGTTGQSKTKSFADSTKAKEAFDKLIKQKTGKGYVEVSQTTSKKTSAAKKKTSKKKTVAKNRHSPIIDVETLTKAVNDNDIGQVKAILKEQPGLLNIQGKTGYTPIHWAVHLDNFELLKLLISLGADVDVVDGAGQTPLHLAAAKGDSVEVVKVLVEAGAELDIKSGRYAYRRTPLYHAAEGFNRIPPYDKPHREIAKLLIDAGATVDANSAVLMKDNDKLRALILENPNLGIVAIDRDELLENAASVLNVEGARILLDQGQLPNRKALIAAMEVSRSENADRSRLKILELYLEAGAGEFLHAIDRHQYPETPYEYAKELAQSKARTGRLPDDFMELIEKFNSET